MVQADLDQQAPSALPEPYTVECLQRQYKALKAAKAHFGIKAGSWAALAAKLNESPLHPSAPVAPPQASLVQRLEVIESEVKTMREDIKQALTLLTLLAEKLL